MLDPSTDIVRLIRRADGSVGAHDFTTGHLVAIIPREAAVEPLSEQVRATTIRRKRERRQEIEAGFWLGVAFVAGAGFGVLLTHL